MIYDAPLEKEEMGATAVRRRVEAMSAEEAARFVRHIDADPALKLSAPDAHMLFRTRHCARKRRANEQLAGEEGGAHEAMPMFSLGGRFLSAHRVMWILTRGEDPVKKSRIESLCGVLSCVNPEHMRIRRPREK